HRLDDLLLVALPVVVAAGESVALPGEVERRFAVHLVAADREGPSGVDRAHLGLDADGDPTEEVDHLLEGAEVHDRGAVEAQPGERGQGGGEEPGPGGAASAVVERGVDLVSPAAVAD